MKTKNDIIIILIGGIFAGFLGFVNHYVKNTVIDFSGENMFGFSNILYIVLPILYFAVGLVVSAIFLKFNSFSTATFVALSIALLISTPSIRTFITYYFHFEPFHETYFRESIFQVCANFVIYPILGFTVWKLKGQFFNV